MEVVTLAKLWGRVGDTPHLSSPARGAGGLETSAFSLYICITWGETPASVSSGATGSLVGLQQDMRDLIKDRVSRPGANPTPCPGP